MVRILLIRHGENTENVLLAYVSAQMQKGLMTEPEALAFFRMHISDSADGPLTKRGEDQAAALGFAWGPALQRYLEQTPTASIHLYVSPQQRALQTMNPLAEVLGRTYTVVPDVAEIPSVTTREDRAAWVPKIRGADARGEFEQVERWMQSMEGRWQAAGMTEAEIGARFPLSRLDHEGLVHTPFPRDGGRWCRWGVESLHRQRRRMRRVAGWLESLREKLPEEDVVCLVCHGAAMALVLRELMADGNEAFNFGGHDNTSVTSVCLDPVSKNPPRLFMANAHYRCRMEWMNRVDHLQRLNGPLNEMEGFLLHRHEANAPTRLRFENDQAAGLEVLRSLGAKL